MFDVNSVARRYFQVKLEDLVLDVEPPKLCIFKELLKLSEQAAGGEYSGGGDVMSGLSGAVAKILGKNRQGVLVTREFVEDHLDCDQMNGILTAFFEWLNRVQNSKN